MKYGLPREDKSKKKWRGVIEDEIRCLQMEVCFLKDQLDETTKKLSELTSFKPTDSFPFKRDDMTVIFKGNQEESVLATVYNELQNLRDWFAAEKPHYESTWDYDQRDKKGLRFHSITCMSNYRERDKSFEELRYEDYMLKGILLSSQIKRFKDSDIRTPRTESNNFTFTPKKWKPMERRIPDGVTNHGADSLGSRFIIPWYLTPNPPKAPWPFGPLPNSNVTSNLPTSNSVSPGASGEVKELNCGSVPPSTFNFLSKSETNNQSDVLAISKKENLSSQILLELKKIGEQISSINDQMVKMDSNLSDVSSRVSVMDSRLSAVDMFVTMQRFDKKWQGLETRLAGLETPSPSKATAQDCSGSGTLLLDESLRKDTNISTQSTTLEENANVEEIVMNISLGNEKSQNSQISEITKCAITTRETNLKDGVNSSLSMDTSDMNLTDFVKSISCSDVTMGSKSLSTSSFSNLSTMSDPSSKTKLEIATIEMANLNPISLTSKTTLVSSPSRTLEEKILVQKHDQHVNSVGKNDDKISDDPLGVTEKRDSSTSLPENSLMEEGDNNIEEGFVVVKKSDVEEEWEDHSKTNPCSQSKLNLEQASSSSDFKMPYSDITEYLEINLGKKKDLVYEFGFEAKPDYLVELKGSPACDEKSVANIENKAKSSPKDDSFQKFKTNFIENKSVDAKQSSPVVFFDSDPAKTSQGKNFNGKSS